MMRAIAITLLFPLLAAAQAPVEVEPADLAKRKDLIGREVVVDDRVKFFFPVPGKGYPEIILSRTDVPVVLPDRLAYSTSQLSRAVRARGILRKKADGSLYIDATEAPELFRSDVIRLKAAMATMVPDDLAAHSGWGDWAAKRAKAFDDNELKDLADQLQAKAISIEYRNPRSRTPDALMALANKARQRGLDEPEPSAIAHVAFRLRLASARTREEYQKIAEEAESVLPNAKSPAKPNVKVPLDAYAKDPYATYRESPLGVRAALDRSVWIDAKTQIYRLRAGGDPAQWKSLGEEAKRELPDHPEVGGDLVRRYYEHLTGNVATLRESEMRELARITREDLKQTEKAIALTRSWLDNKRKSLGGSDSEQRVDLASKYLAYLKDRVAAADLTREALKIDPTNRAATDLFQRMGFVKSGDTWRDPSDPAAKPAAPVGDEPGPIGRDDPLLRLTAAEVKAQLGEPKRTSRVATQGRVSIQWVYESTRGAQYIDFVQRAGDPQPIVTGRFSVR